MLRKEKARNRRSQARTVVISPSRVPMTRGASLRSRVKGNFQARFWSSGGRGDSPTDCRKLSERCIGLGSCMELFLYNLKAHFPQTDVVRGNPRFFLPASVENNCCNGFSFTGSLKNVCVSETQAPS